MVNQQAYPYILSSLFASMCYICMYLCLTEGCGHVSAVDIRMLSAIASHLSFWDRISSLSQATEKVPGNWSLPHSAMSVGRFSSDYSLCGSCRSKLRTSCLCKMALPTGICLHLCNLYTVLFIIFFLLVWILKIEYMVSFTRKVRSLYL